MDYYWPAASSFVTYKGLADNFVLIILTGEGDEENMENGKKGDSLVKRVLGKNEFILLVLMVILSIVLNSSNSAFLTLSNFLSMSRGFAIEGIALVGMSMLLIIGMFPAVSAKRLLSVKI